MWWPRRAPGGGGSCGGIGGGGRGDGSVWMWERRAGEGGRRNVDDVSFAGGGVSVKVAAAVVPAVIVLVVVRWCASVNRSGGYVSGKGDVPTSLGPAAVA
jgi:hypothetical protein